MRRNTPFVPSGRCCSRTGAVVVAFCNGIGLRWGWDPKTFDAPNATAPTYVVRSPDGGKTWEPPQKLHDDWTGAIRDIIQLPDGSVLFTSMMMRHNPGHHTVVTYRSADDGRTWQRSNVIDLGGVGHHGGVTEATIEQLRDGRIWMLMRTNWKTFWEAYSTDGLRWDGFRSSGIDASSAPACSSASPAAGSSSFGTAISPRARRAFRCPAATANGPRCR